MTTTRMIYCISNKCVHYLGTIGPLDDPVFCCDAFPTGIPDEIMSGENDHTEPFPGDDGIMFEAVTIKKAKRPARKRHA